MKNLYIQPEVHVTEIQSMVVMQVASPAGNSMGFHDTLGEQW